MTDKEEDYFCYFDVHDRLVRVKKEELKR